MDVYYPQEMEQGTILPAVILVSGELPPEFKNEARIQAYAFLTDN